MVYDNLFFNRLDFLMSSFGFEHDKAVDLLESYPQHINTCVFDYMHYYDIKPDSREGLKLTKLLYNYES